MVPAEVSPEKVRRNMHNKVSDNETKRKTLPQMKIAKNETKKKTLTLDEVSVC